MQIVRPAALADIRLGEQRVWTSLDCSNGGISATCDQVTIVGMREGINSDAEIEPLPRRAQCCAPTKKAPAAVLVKRYLQGVTVWHVEPLEATGWLMAGGTYCATSDSRINEITGVYGALALHDRIEG